MLCGVRVIQDAMMGLAFEATVIDPAAVADMLASGAWREGSAGAAAVVPGSIVADLAAHADLLIMFQRRKKAVPSQA